ncbi:MULTISPECIES: M56 family metallopeptidase [Flavobacteriaceae]|uniref:M56 family metallopeptidase n=1 Tax=Flavobacteriaceae TaxID=49546 RepID=UPI001491FE44|nr:MULTISPECIES: M56 family metallopeptidase [Allomuricauda]MDC6367678.1 M56 family metallopeptidase [Muricauda sp. AC10]
MVQYILEILAFQLIFLLTYDLFLKKETFFQWNRVYLIITFICSLILPWVKLETLKTTVPFELGNVSVFLVQLDEVVLESEEVKVNILEQLPWYYWVMVFGSLVATIWFGYKLFQIQKLRANGLVSKFPNFTKVTVEKSELAFSFFRNIFLGRDIQKEKESDIIAHELVHIKQWHSLDLLFFELARIAFWFNPLVYVYQSRISELHEFIADAQVAKNDKKKQYQLLLSEAFGTPYISFVNQFFKQSLIKKRIVMLTKEKSKRIYQLKYALLLPLVLGMLLYTSCETQKENSKEDFFGSVSGEEEVKVGYKDNIKTFSFDVDDLNELTEEDRKKQAELLNSVEEDKETAIIEMTDKLGQTIKIEVENGVVQSVIVNKNSNAKYVSDATKIPFAKVDESPIFPGCEDASDTRDCFRDKIQEHIRKHFNYPEEAQEQGIQGRVNLIFIINENGDIVDIATRGPSPILEAEAERIIKRLPKMQPGKHEGKLVEVPFSIPITFKLQ